MKIGTKSTIAMKKNFYIITAAALSLVACSRNQEIDVPDAKLALFARTESPADTKTVVESGVHVYWEPGDEIAVFTGEQSAKFTTDITAASGTATFKGTFGDATRPEDLDLWAVYPFSEDAVFDGETITTTLPSEQVAREGSFGKDMNLAIAHSSGTTLQFYNVGGGIRFSVTEEGIKKVMFEGLSGEIISGKVKIGFEDGLPVVKEVTGGSQFITLLPPDGSETFEPGTWYFIVAIPGSLEGGYKLRFYKDSDYARKVSEKKVEIKRSIFGNIEKADEGIEYEATTTHFPSSKEEWIESVVLTNQINESISSILESSQNSIFPINQGLLEAIQDIEGILSVSMASDTSSVSYLQKDSVWCNYILKSQSDHHLYSSGEDDDWNSPYFNPGVFRKTTEENNAQPKSAFIYVPFQWDFAKPINTWISNLGEQIGKDNIVVRGKDIDDVPNDGDVFELKEQLSRHYDLIILDTHGMIGHTERDSDSDTFTTLLATSTLYSAEIVEELHKNGINDNQFGSGYNDGVAYVYISPDFLESNRFDNTAVILSACNSARLIDFSDNDDQGSMIGAFINRGAALVTGAKVTMSVNALDIFVSKLIELLKSGLSFQDVFDYLTTKNGRLDIWLNYLFSYMCKYHTLTMLSDERTHSDYNIPDNYIVKYNEKHPNPFFLFSVNPVLNNPNTGSENVSFTWNCALNNFNLQWPTEIVRRIKDWGIKEETIMEAVDYSILYDVYIDGGECFSNIRDKSVSNSLSYGNYFWYVIAKITDGDRVLASYQSDIGRFSVKGEQYQIPDAKNLGLPSGLKWASFNLGATKPEEYGHYYAWGETEPKGYFDWMNYAWGDIEDGNGLTKYTEIDSSSQILDPEDDAAHVNLGGYWRMPTKADFEELIAYCTAMWDEINGIQGMKFTSNINGEWIFLPVAGYSALNYFENIGGIGYYWSSSLSSTTVTKASYLTIGNAYRYFDEMGRAFGLSIRPVYGDQKPPTSGDIEGTERDPWN